MTPLYLLVILTALPTGEISAAFVGTETKAQCEARGDAIRGILEAGKVEIREYICLESGQRFEKFVHGGPADAPRHVYAIKFGPKSVQIEAQTTLHACESTLRGIEKVEGMRTYCATSTQAMLVAPDAH